MNRKYELTVIYYEGDDKRKEGIDFLEGVLAKHEAKILSKDELGVKKFAYEIKKEQRGFYIFYIIECDGLRISKIAGELNLSHLLLRYLFVEKSDLTKFQIKKKENREKKMRDFLALKARNANPVVPSVPNKDKEAEEEILGDDNGSAKVEEENKDE